NSKLTSYEEKKLNTSTRTDGRDEDCQNGQSDVGTKMVQRVTTTEKTATTKETKKNRLLSNPDIKRWYDNLARGSRHTAESRLRKLGRFCEEHELTPMQLAELGMKDHRAATDLIQDHITKRTEEGMSHHYIKSVITA